MYTLYRVQSFLISTITSITTLVQTTVISYLDHCDCLLMGLPVLSLAPKPILVPVQKSGRSLAFTSEHCYSSAHVALEQKSSSQKVLPVHPQLSPASPLSAFVHLLLQPHSNHKILVLFLKPARQVLAVLSACNAPPSDSCLSHLHHACHGCCGTRPGPLPPGMKLLPPTVGVLAACVNFQLRSSPQRTYP